MGLVSCVYIELQQYHGLYVQVVFEVCCDGMQCQMEAAGNSIPCSSRVSSLPEPGSEANGNDPAPRPPPLIGALPLLKSSKVAYGVEFVEEIKGHGKVETISQKWPVVRGRAPYRTLYASSPSPILIFPSLLFHMFYILVARCKRISKPLVLLYVFFTLSIAK